MSTVTRICMALLIATTLVTSSCAQYRAVARSYIDEGLEEKHALNESLTYYSQRWVCEDISVRALQDWLTTQELMDAWEKLCGKQVAIPPSVE